MSAESAYVEYERDDGDDHMKPTVMTLLLLLNASAVSAQTLEAEADLRPLGLAEHDLVPVDADGDPDTEEWLAMPREFSEGFRVLAVTPTGLCSGPPFHPAGDLEYPRVLVVRRGRRDVLLVRDRGGFGPHVRLVGLTRPRCQS